MKRPSQAILSLAALIIVAVLGAFALQNLGTASKDIELLQVFNLDEGAGTWQLVQNIKAKDFDPRGFFNYGYAYINISHLIVKGIGALGFDTSSEQLAAIVLRSVSLLSWLLLFVTTYLSCRNFRITRLFSLLASATMLGLPKVFEYAQFVHPDILQMALCSTAVFIISKNPFKQFNILMSTLVLGLAFGTKYSGIFILPFPLFLLLYGFLKQKLKFKELVLYSIVSLVLFLAGWLAFNPYVLSDWPLFIEDFKYESEHVSRGHWRAESSNPLVWFQVLFSQFQWTLLALITGLSALFLKLKTKANTSQEIVLKIMLLVFLVGLIYLMIQVNMRRPRYLFHLLPLLVIPSFYGLSKLNEELKYKFWIPLSVLLLLLFPLQKSFAIYKSYSNKMEHNYVKAGEWMTKNYPGHIKILSDYYSYLPKEHFTNAFHTFGITKPEIDGHGPSVIILNESLSGMRSWKEKGSEFSDLQIIPTDRDGAEELNEFHYWLFSESSGWKIVYEEVNIVILEKELNSP